MIAATRSPATRSTLLRHARRLDQVRRGAALLKRKRQSLVEELFGRARTAVTWAVLAMFVLGYAAAWFYFNLGRMPPYIPGAFPDPIAPPAPEAVAWLAFVTGAVVLPGCALACVLAFRAGARVFGDAPSSREMLLPR